MQSQPPVEFTDEIKSLFVEKKLAQARQRLLDTLSNQWDGHCNLIAFTYLYAENRTADDCINALEWLEKGVVANEVEHIIRLDGMDSGVYQLIIVHNNHKTVKKVIKH